MRKVDGVDRKGIGDGVKGDRAGRMCRGGRGADGWCEEGGGDDTELKFEL